jgi:hypothetical protein
MTLAQATELQSDGLDAAVPPTMHERLRRNKAKER